MSTGSIRLAREGLAVIETLNGVGPSGPTVDQQEKLGSWPGWGPFAPAFDPEPDGAWQEIYDRLDRLLSAGELASAGECVDNSFYTPPEIVGHVWDLLARTGIGKTASSGGVRMLEPGCGSGRFMSSTPDGWDVDWTGVESDPVSARVAAALNPASFREGGARLAETSVCAGMMMQISEFVVKTPQVPSAADAFAHLQANVGRWGRVPGCRLAGQMDLPEPVRSGDTVLRTYVNVHSGRLAKDGPASCVAVFDDESPTDVFGWVFFAAVAV